MSLKKMFHLLLNQMFLFTKTFKLFGAETRVTEIQQLTGNLAHRNLIYIECSLGVSLHFGC
jgi:hypothetical protein